ncbi:hypothetical protein [Methylobacterium sp. E-046]|uniref:hypothetical protein n=1 Tax=Methylobacterium sp. E-046 TaxID=2836576 RepID=UPI001FBA5697|nr:hypothetical protein [Methylobacterium sp. E-046]MCJ2098932.1 hypothetical protein [Methylobacterium sp. E-046]
MTQILNLPQLAFSVATGTNEDWTDAWGFVDASGNPISGAGITLNMMLRRAADDPEVQIVASSVSGPVGGLQLNGSLSWGGVGLSVITLAIPASTMEGIPAGSYVAEVQAVAEGHVKTITVMVVTIVQGVVR